MGSHRSLIGLLIAGLLIASGAGAGPLRMTGHDAPSMGQGGGEIAYGHGPGVLFSNPALMTQVEPGFHVTFTFVQPFISVDLMDRPANSDIPITFYDSDVGLAGSNLERPLPTSELRVARADNKVDSFTSYLGLGLFTTLGVEEWVQKETGYSEFGFRFGLAAQVPTSGLLNIASQYPDEREQFFSNTVHMPRFGEWSKVLSLQFGLAVRFADWLSFGVTAEGGLNVGATLDMYIPEATVQDFALVNVAFDATPTVRPVIGFASQPLDWLSIGLVFRDRRFSEVDADAMLNLWNYHEPGNETAPKRVQQRHLLALDFEPMEVSFAVGATFADAFVQASVTWNHWSDFIDTHHKRAQENAVWDLETNPDAVPDMGYEWNDTFSVALGAGYEYLDGHMVTLGGGWRPTPVPDQVGRTNYADADLFNFALGHRVDFEIAGHWLRLDLGLQLWLMGKTTVHKDPDQIKDEFPDDSRTSVGGQPMPEASGLQTNNPGFPGYSFGGLALAGSITVVYLF